MVGRREALINAAANEIIEITHIHPDMLPVMVLDLASLQSVRDFATKFKASKYSNFHFEVQLQ